MNKLIFFSLIFVLNSNPQFAQNPADFTGVWKQDTLKSDDYYKLFDVEYVITQTPQTFNVKQILKRKNRKDSLIREYSFTLDGKVTIEMKDGGVEKNSAKWSGDKKTLTTKSIEVFCNQESGFIETYSLSDNGLVLTTHKSDLKSGVLTVKQVFNKKQ